MHFLIGLGILAGLAGFAFGAGAARVLVGGVLLAIVAIVVVAVIATEREQKAAVRERSVAQAKWEESVREQEARYPAKDAALGLAPGECVQGAYDSEAKTSVCIRWAGAYDAAQHIATVGPCMEKHNWDNDAERVCDK